MFTNWASYIINSFQNRDATAVGVEEDSSIKLRAIEENDWLLVDRDSEGNSETSSVKSNLEDYDITQNIIPLQPVSLTRCSSASSLPNTANMEESWFVTPPPCFTSSGPVVMRTSPLENLLIEHPSMSVYHIHPRRTFSVRSVRSTSSASRSSIEDIDLEVEEVRENIRAEQVAVDTRLPRFNRLQVIQQQEKQYIKARKAQKVQIQKTCKPIKRGNLQRQNKAREVNSRNQRQRRGERSQGAVRSYANNNRKC